MLTGRHSGLSTVSQHFELSNRQPIIKVKHRTEHRYGEAAPVIWFASKLGTHL